MANVVCSQCGSDVPPHYQIAEKNNGHATGRVAVVCHTCAYSRRSLVFADPPAVVQEEVAHDTQEVTQDKETFVEGDSVEGAQVVDDAGVDRPRRQASRRVKHGK